MTPKVIKTEHDHDEALERIDKLMDAQPGTPEFDELELLTHLVENYEEKAYPIDSPDPIEAIRFRMEQAELSQKDLIPYMGSQSKISEVLHGRRTLSLSMMRALHQGLGIPAEILLQDPNASFPEDSTGLDWSRFPIADMMKRGWLSFQGSLAEAKDKAEEIITAALPEIRNLSRQGAKLRQHIRTGSRMDSYALLAWRAKVIALAGERTLPKYSPDTITPGFMQQLVNQSFLDDSPLLAREFLEKNGIILVVLKHLPKTHLDGAAMLLPTGNPVVAMTLRRDRLDNFWFTLCHELGHVWKHLTAKSDDCFIDDLDAKDDGLEESWADKFSADSLIPPARWKHSRARLEKTPKAVLAMAKSLRIHPAIVAGRIRFETNAYKILPGLVGNKMVRKLFPEYLKLN